MAILAIKEGQAVPVSHTTVSALLEAPAKISLSLRIVGRRPDGYHLLDLQNCLVNLQDDVAISMAPGNGIAVSLDDASTTRLNASDLLPEQNLSSRAVMLFFQSFGLHQSVSIRITKRIPVGAGMGGGSSDAGAVLRFLWCHFRPQASLSALNQIALSLGADVPYFLQGGLAQVRGIGESVQTLPYKTPLPGVILIVPPWQLPTPQVYQKFRQLVPNVSQLESSRESSNFVLGQSPLRNDLALAVEALSPATSELLRALALECGLNPMVTGSGSVLFCLVPSAQDSPSVREAAAGIASRFGARCIETHLRPDPFVDLPRETPAV